MDREGRETAVSHSVKRVTLESSKPNHQPHTCMGRSSKLFIKTLLPSWSPALLKFLIDVSDLFPYKVSLLPTACKLAGKLPVLQRATRG